MDYYFYAILSSINDIAKEMGLKCIEDLNGEVPENKHIWEGLRILTDAVKYLLSQDPDLNKQSEWEYD